MMQKQAVQNIQVYFIIVSVEVVCIIPVRVHTNPIQDTPHWCSTSPVSFNCISGRTVITVVIVIQQQAIGGRDNQNCMEPDLIKMH